MSSPASSGTGTQPILWPAEALWQAVAPMLPGFTVEVLPQIDSSNSELMRRFRTGTPPLTEPTLLVAEQQTAGRGRQGRSWHSQRAGSLTFSLGLTLHRPDWSGLSLVVGISLAESLDPSGKAIGLKWPNDLWLLPSAEQPGVQTERKLAGILVETASWEGHRYGVIGVGINIRPLPESAQPLAPGAALPMPVSLSMPPGYLQHTYADLDAPAALLRVLPALVRDLQAFDHFGFAPFQARFAQRDVLAGRAVELFGELAGNQGTAHGVGEDGALQVLTASGMKHITSAEVSVRPLGAAAAPVLREGTAPC